MYPLFDDGSHRRDPRPRPDADHWRVDLQWEVYRTLLEPDLQRIAGFQAREIGSADTLPRDLELGAVFDHGDAQVDLMRVFL